jgi:macrolide-specific efflux system membrane fusion protein
VEVSVVAAGSLLPKQMVNVGAQVSGQLMSLSVRAGDRVSTKQLIAEIDPTLPENALRSATAAVEILKAQRRSAEASLLLAEQSLKRNSELVSDGFTSRQDYEIAVSTVNVRRAELDGLLAQIAGAQVTLDTARANLSYTRITAPIEGTVIGIVTKQGQTVNANQSAPVIVVIANLDVMTVTAQISEADVPKVKIGQRARFTTLGDSDRQYSGSISSIDSVPDSFVEDLTSVGARKSGTVNNAVYYLARFEIDNNDHVLRTGMTVQVNIVLTEAKKALTIPASALRDRVTNGMTSVRVISASGGNEVRQVNIGLDNNIVAEVRGGLSRGERVATPY